MFRVNALLLLRTTVSVLQLCQLQIVEINPTTRQSMCHSPYRKSHHCPFYKKSICQIKTPKIINILLTIQMVIWFQLHHPVGIISLKRTDPRKVLPHGLTQLHSLNSNCHLHLKWLFLQTILNLWRL